MPSAFILAVRGYPALPLARQLAHQRYVLPNPLVLGKKPLKSPAPTTDRDRPVSRRSKPSSRTAFIGEQPNPWELLHPQDAMSRHRTEFHSFLWRRLCLHPVVDFRPRGHDLTCCDRSRRIAWSMGSKPHLSDQSLRGHGDCRLQILDCRFANLGLPTALPGKEPRLSDALAFESASYNLKSAILPDGFTVISRFVGRESLP